MAETEITLPIRNVVDLMPDSLAELVKKAQIERPELMTNDEKWLYRKLGTLGAQPSPIDNRIRLSFWEEYTIAQNECRNMNMVRVYGGTCTEQFFRDRYLARPEKVAWMMCQPANYATTIRESLQFGIDRMRDILELPVCEVDDQGRPKGKINTTLAALQFRIMEKLHTLVHGAVVQKNVNINIGQEARALDRKMQEALLGNDMDELQRRLKELEKKDRLAGPKEVEVEVVVEPAKD